MIGIKEVSHLLMGDPNHALSSAQEWRYGSRGSLSIDLEKNTWFCHENNIGGGVVDLVEYQIGGAREKAVEWLKDNFGTSKKREIITTYEYTDEAGKLLFEVVRFEPKDFRQRRPDGKDWIWSLKGVRRVLYRLPELQGQAVVYLVEGEKDADRLSSLNLTATCCPGGAGKWREDYTQQLVAAGVKSVVIFPDNDEAGRKHADQVAESTQKAGLQTKLVQLPRLPEKGDVFDWLAAGHGRDELIALVKAAEVYRPEAKPLSLNRFTLNGKAQDMKKKMLEDKFIVGRFAIVGQSTVFYAKPNAGKTLLLIWFIIEAIKDGTIQGEDVFYINADDNYKGLCFKLELAERYGFMMLAPGHNGFEANMLRDVLMEMIDNDQARGKIIILDTVKKFVDVMRKDRASAFGEAVRQFVSHGGSVIMLAHVNKHRDEENKVIFSGTSDLVDDADCAYTLDILTDDKATGTRTVKFENFKCRGDVALEAVYEYNAGEGVTYQERLDSVRLVGDEERQEVERRNRLDAMLERNREAVEAIKESIKAGHTQKTALLADASERAGLSRRRISKALRDHTGNRLDEHQFWHVSVEARNAHVYQLNWGV